MYADSQVNIEGVGNPRHSESRKQSSNSKYRRNAGSASQSMKSKTPVRGSGMRTLDHSEPRQGSRAYKTPGNRHSVGKSTTY